MAFEKRQPVGDIQRIEGRPSPAQAQRGPAGCWKPEDCADPTVPVANLDAERRRSVKAALDVDRKLPGSGAAGGIGGMEPIEGLPVLEGASRTHHIARHPRRGALGRKKERPIGGECDPRRRKEPLVEERPFAAGPDPPDPARLVGMDARLANT